MSNENDAERKGLLRAVRVVLRLGANGEAKDECC